MAQLSEALGKYEVMSTRLAREREVLLEQRERWLEALWIHDDESAQEPDSEFESPASFDWLKTS